MADTLETLKAALADRYRIEREIGRGGMATVHLAVDVEPQALAPLIQHPMKWEGITMFRRTLLLVLVLSLASTVPAVAE